MVDKQVKVDVVIDVEKAQSRLRDLQKELADFSRTAGNPSQGIADLSHIMSAQKNILSIKRSLNQESDKEVRNARELKRLSLDTVGATLGALGGYKAKHAITAFSRFEELSEKTGSIVETFGALAEAAGPIALAFPFLFAATKGVELALGLVEKAAMQVASGMAKIGGLRSLDSIIEETASVQRNGALIARYSRTPMSPNQVFNTIENMSAGSPFNSTQTSEIALAYAQSSGGRSDLLNAPVNTGAGTFGQGLMELADVYKINPEKLAQTMGNYGAMTGATANQQLDWGMKSLSLQQEGGIDVFSNPNIASKLFNEGKFGLDTELANATLWARGVGGTTRSDVTKQLQYEKKHPGADTFAEDIKAGQTQEMLAIKNYLKNKGVDVEDVKAIRNFRDVLADGTNAGKNFTQMLVDAQSTVEDKWKIAVNRMTSTIEKSLLPVLIELTPEVEELAKYIADHKEEVANGVKSLGSALIHISEGLVAFSGVVFTLINKVLNYVFPDSVEEGRKAKQILSQPQKYLDQYSREFINEMKEKVAIANLVEKATKEAKEELTGGVGTLPKGTASQNRTQSGEAPAGQHAKATAEHTYDMKSLLERQTLITQQLKDQNARQHAEFMATVRSNNPPVRTAPHPGKN